MSVEAELDSGYLASWEECLPLASSHPVCPESDELIFVVTDEWHVVRAQNMARDALEIMKVSKLSSAYIVTALSELATNLFFHSTNGGTIRFRFRSSRGGCEVVIVSEDDGPGISDLDQALMDGFSTSGGLGGGLPGVKRLMDQFDIESKAGSGTRVSCRKWSPCK